MGSFFSCSVDRRSSSWSGDGYVVELLELQGVVNDPFEVPEGRCDFFETPQLKRSLSPLDGENPGFL